MRVLLSTIIVVLSLAGCSSMKGTQQPPACDLRAVEQLRKTYSGKMITLKNRLADKMSVKNVIPDPGVKLLQSVRSLESQIRSSHQRTEKSCRALANCAAAYKNDLVKCSREQADWEQNSRIFTGYATPINNLDSKVRLLKLEKVDPAEQAKKKKAEANRAKDCKPVVGTVFTECK